MTWTIDDVDQFKEGLSPRKKKQWVRLANSTLKKLIKKGESEEDASAKAIKQANGVVNINTSDVYSSYKTKQILDYEVGITVHQEKAHLVIPVVMMVEGVHNGSQGPILHSIEELGKFPASWDGIPVVIYHPEKDGQPVSANSPDIIDTMAVGRVYNTSVEGKKLKAEVWLDEDKLNSVSDVTLEKINDTEEMEVSLGMFTENDDEEGVFGGEKYEMVAYNHRPDHLAILPDQIGACSCADGCGIGANQKLENMKEIKLLIQEKVLSQTLQNFNKEGYKLSVIGNNADESYNERMRMMYDKLRSMETAGSKIYYYLEEMYDDYLIYAKEGDNDRVMYKQTYKIDSGKVEFVGEPIEVHKKVEYVVTNVVANNNLSINKNKEDKKMLRGKECPECVEKINALIANTESGFVEGDRVWLETLEASALDKITPKVIEKEKIVEVEKTVEVNKLSPEDQQDLAWAKAQRKERREKLIKGIQDNAGKERWSDEKLAKFDDAMLADLFESVKKEETTDYSLNDNLGINRRAEEIEPMPPAGIEFEESKN